MPEDSPIGGRDSEEMVLDTPVLSTVKSGGLREDCPLPTSPVLGIGLKSPAQPVPLAMIAPR